MVSQLLGILAAMQAHNGFQVWLHERVAYPNDMQTEYSWVMFHYRIYAWCVILGLWQLAQRSWGETMVRIQSPFAASPGHPGEIRFHWAGRNKLSHVNSKFIHKQASRHHHHHTHHISSMIHIIPYPYKSTLNHHDCATKKAPESPTASPSTIRHGGLGSWRPITGGAELPAVALGCEGYAQATWIAGGWSPKGPKGHLKNGDLIPLIVMGIEIMGDYVPYGDRDHDRMLWFSGVPLGSGMIWYSHAMSCSSKFLDWHTKSWPIPQCFAADFACEKMSSEVSVDVSCLSLL